MKSFFEKLAGVGNIDESIDINDSPEKSKKLKIEHPLEGEGGYQDQEWSPEETPEEGELTIDMYEKPEEIVIKTIVAGVKPDDLDISITRDTITIRGKRQETHSVSEEDYFVSELYWGSFSRTLSLPEEIDIEKAEALEEYGMLTLKLPKVDKGRKAKLKVKTKH